MKTKLCLLTLISIFFIEVAYSQQIGWTSDELIRLKGKNYERKDYDDGTYCLFYEKKIIFNGKEEIEFSDLYFINSTTNKVYKYTGLGQKSESEIIDIIEKNNSKFKKVDLGSKQKNFQWIDTENIAEYNLAFFPEMNLGEKKFILYSVEVK